MSDFNIDPEAINKYVADQIIASALGDKLREAINEEIKRLGGYGMDNPLKSHVQMTFSDMARDYLKTPEMQEIIKNKIKDKLTAEAVGEIIGNIKLGSY